MPNCRSCNAEIQWCTTEKGKSIPVDAKPVEYGGNIVIRDGVAHVLGKGEPSGAGEARYRSHFVTCKNAAYHRKPASTDAPKTKRGKNAPAATEKPPTSTLFGEANDT